MSEEAKTETTNGNATPPAATPPTTALAVINKSEAVQAWELTMRRASAYAKSSMVPKEYQGDKNMANVIIALELADRIGASPFQVMQNLDIIHGRPSWRGQFLIATVNASGRFTPLRFEWQGKPGTNEWGCRAVAKDLKTGTECPGSWITWGMAKAEGWVEKAGSKWKTMPEQMFMYRAGAFWTRTFAPELSLGLQTAEEAIDTTGEVVPDAIASNDTKTLEAQLLAQTTDGATYDKKTGEVVEEPAKSSAREPGEEG